MFMQPFTNVISPIGNAQNMLIPYKAHTTRLFLYRTTRSLANVHEIQRSLVRLSSTAPRMSLHPSPQAPGSRSYKPIYGCPQSISETSSPLSARSSARYVGSWLALRYVPGQRKALSVRPPFRSRAAKRAFHSPSAPLRLHSRHIPLPLHSTPTSLLAHSAALTLHSDLTMNLLRSVCAVSPYLGCSPLLGCASPPA